MQTEIATNRQEVIDFYSIPEIRSDTLREESGESAITAIADQVVREHMSYRIATNGGKLAGFILVERVFDIAIVHLAMHRWARGKFFNAAARKVMEILWRNGVKEIQVHIPSFNLTAQYAAARLGFERYDTQYFSWRKDGIHYDLICYRKERP